MNERIQELLKQAGGIQYDEDGDELTPILVGKDLEKFAELIVRECIKMVETEAAQYAEPVWAFELVNDMYEQWEISP